MIINCPKCDTRYTLPAAKIGAAGRTMKCASCGESWFQAPGDDDAPAPTRANPPPLAPNMAQGVDTHTADEAQKKSRKLPTIPLPIVLVTLAILILFSTGGAALWWFSQPTGPDGFSPVSFQNNIDESTLHQPTGLVLADIERELIEDGPIKVLLFRGKVTNTNPIPVSVPEIRIQLLNSRGVELDFWPADIQKNVLDPEESSTWVVRFLNPPLDKIAQFKAFFKEPQNDL